jgi:CelD/BcsL family acetyltransferase involved in cellulose biosynthesis
MTIDIIQTQSGLDDLKSIWNPLLAQSASHVPFLRHEYLSTWWETKGGGEWQEGELFILAWRESGGDIRGIAPLFLAQERILFLGSFEISDYLDFITPPNLLPSFLGRVFEFLSNDFTDWKTLDLYNLPEASPTIPVIKKIGEKSNWVVNSEILQPSPGLILPESWEEYLSSLEDRYRNEIERKLRKAEEYFLPVDWYIVDESQDLDQELDDFLELMRNNREKAAFLTEDMAAQIKTSAEKAYKAGWLQLAFLTVGDLKAAGYLNFDFDHKIWIYNSGINTMFENIYPGWVLLAKLIQWSIEEGKTMLDFMRGGEGYKYHFGGKDSSVVRVQARRT